MYCIYTSSFDCHLYSDVNKDLTFKDKDQTLKAKDQTYKDQTPKFKD